MMKQSTKGLLRHTMPVLHRKKLYYFRGQGYFVKSIIMNKTFILFLTVFTVISACTSPPKNTAKNSWIKLFNGRDMNDWVVKIHHYDVGDNYGQTFRVDSNMIKVRYDKYGPFNERYGHCTTKRLIPIFI